jgi:hypothetical protein
MPIEELLHVTRRVSASGVHPLLLFSSCFLLSLAKHLQLQLLQKLLHESVPARRHGAPGLGLHHGPEPTATAARFSPNGHILHCD